MRMKRRRKGGLNNTRQGFLSYGDDDNSIT
jgi:hypothetical protein